jgi:hypothetical protein
MAGEDVQAPAGPSNLPYSRIKGVRMHGCGVNVGP